MGGHPSMIDGALVGHMQDQGTGLGFLSGQCMPSLGLQEGFTGPMYTFLYSNEGEKAQIKVWHGLGFQESILFWSCQPAPARATHSLGVWGPKRSTLSPRSQLGVGRAQSFAACLSCPDRKVPPDTSLQRPFPCATEDSAGGRPSMEANDQLSQDPSILPGSLFTPSPSREQTLPRNRAHGCSCHAGGDSLWNQAKSTAQEASYPPLSPIGAATYVPLEIRGNFMFAYERTLDVSWGEDLQET